MKYLVPFWSLSSIGAACAPAARPSSEITARPWLIVRTNVMTPSPSSRGRMMCRPSRRRGLAISRQRHLAGRLAVGLAPFMLHLAENDPQPEKASPASLQSGALSWRCRHRRRELTHERVQLLGALDHE